MALDVLRTNVLVLEVQQGEDTLSGFCDALVTAQYVITALSSGLNTCYFMSYRSPRKRRRVGAVTLTVVSLAMFVESLYFGLYAFSRKQPWAEAFYLDPERWLMARLLLCIASVLITILILRQLWAKRGGRK